MYRTQRFPAGWDLVGLGSSATSWQTREPRYARPSSMRSPDHALSEATCVASGPSLGSPPKGRCFSTSPHNAHSEKTGGRRNLACVSCHVMSVKNFGKSVIAAKSLSASSVGGANANGHHYDSLGCHQIGETLLTQASTKFSPIGWDSRRA